MREQNNQTHHRIREVGRSEEVKEEEEDLIEMQKYARQLEERSVGFAIDYFDDDEYLNELFLSIHGTIFFTMHNQDDRSFLLEDENDFSNDFFFTYFVL